MPPFDTSWRSFLGGAYVDGWRRNAHALYEPAGQEVYPQQANVFRAFQECPRGHLKVVIVGEAPYDNGNADGLAFSVPSGVPVPPSLWIVFSTIWREFDPVHDVQHADGNLVRWAQQGVLLLNSRLTIGQIPDSIRWGFFTRRVLEKIYEDMTGIVFMLWGNEAQKRGEHIVNNGEHLVLRSSHPSPQSAWNEPNPFVGCQHFSRANQWLIQRGHTDVDWA